MMLKSQKMPKYTDTWGCQIDKNSGKYLPARRYWTDSKVKEQVGNMWNKGYCSFQGFGFSAWPVVKDGRDLISGPQVVLTSMLTAYLTHMQP